MVYEDITQQREQEDDLSGETEPREVDGYGIFKSFSGEHTGYFQGLGAGPRPPKSTAHIQAQLDAQQREVEQARKELDEVLAILKEVQSQMQNERQLRKKMQTQFLAHMEHQRAMQEQLQVSISFQIQEAMQTTLSLSRSFSVCMICLTNEKDLAFGCGHMICRECGSRLSNCPLCRKQITCRLRLFPQ
ncbi:E3 ubiquitin-protein ligase RGLG2-like [Quillaja saponaria]|nr:E3 ubiquitin-protein ligase RGLG2-like [Quillaja saponaria]